jgi:hypothetical protein
MRRLYRVHNLTLIGPRWPKTTTTVHDSQRSIRLLLYFQLDRRGNRFALLGGVTANRDRGKEEDEMKTKLMALLLLAGSALMAGPRVFVGVGAGYAAPAPVYAYGPMPAPVYSSYVAPCPGPGYSWVGGYWYPSGARYGWHAGYWARPAFAGARWAAPRYHAHRYYGGYWRR